MNEVFCCPGCGYTYASIKGDPRQGFAPGTPWSAIPEDWDCPACGVRKKPDFVATANKQEAPITPH